MEPALRVADQLTDRNLSLTFLGAAGTLTGSRYLITAEGRSYLVDCGLFQGGREIQSRNREALSVSPADSDAVILTHAHLDHSGFLPVLVRKGFTGPIYATAATRDLCEIILRDSAYLQERDAERSARYDHGNESAPPLYLRRHVEQTMDLFDVVPFQQPTSLIGSDSVCFHRAGHILGAASVSFEIAGRRVLFSGDLGREDDLIMRAPDPRPPADYVVMESTYGDRVHRKEDPFQALKRLIESAAARGGTIIIPAFTVGRTQTILHCLSKLKLTGWMSSLPVFLDSPMAIQVCDLYRRYPAELKLSDAEMEKAFSVATFVHDADGSRALDQSPFPKIIVCASGMAVGGRVLHHLKSYLENPSNLIIFTGFQAPGTRGESLTEGTDSIRIHRHDFEVRAQITQLNMFSAHADSEELLDWLGHGPAPELVCITHGTESAAATLAQSISGRLGYRVTIPSHGEVVSLADIERSPA